MAKANADKVGSTKKISTKKPSLDSKSSVKPKYAPKSEEVVIDSDEELESEEDSPGQQLREPVPQKPKTNGASKSSVKKAVGSGSTNVRAVQQDLESASSSEESEDESTEEEGDSPSSDEPRSDKRTAVANGPTATRNDESSDEEESSEEDTEDEGNARKAILSARNPAAAQSADEEQDASASGRPIEFVHEVFTNKPRPAKTFKPPRDFERIAQDIERPATSQIKSSLSAGRQIWHITAPRGVPLSSIKRLTLKAIADGKTVLSHNNIDYAFTMDSQNAKPTQLLLPSEKGYELSQEPFSRQLHLRQVIKLNTTTSPQPAPLTSTPQKRKRAQPAGLKQRFLPMGVVTPSPDPGRDVFERHEAEQPPSEFRVPRSLPNGDDVEGSADKKRKKRKHDETEEERAARKAAKKAKKAAKAAASLQEGQGTDAREAKVKKKEKDKHLAKAS